MVKINTAVNFNSPEFDKILETINKVLIKYNIEPLTYNSTSIIKSLYDKGIFGNRSLWRITGDMIPALNNYRLVKELQRATESAFPEYIKNGTILIGSYKSGDKWVSTIKILPGSLKDNTFTVEDLDNYGKDDLVTAKLNDLETRMYRRPDDTRTPETRWDDFKWANIYEEKLLEAELKNVSRLQLQHKTNIFSIDPPEESDFKGVINDQNFAIEGKSTWDTLDDYEDTIDGHNNFVNYFSNKKLGSFHDSKYILFVSKITGKIICIDRNNYANNWLAGKIKLD